MPPRDAYVRAGFEPSRANFHRLAKKPKVAQRIAELIADRERLVAAAKERMGMTSDTHLVELALAYLAVGDDFGEWLVAQGGRLPADFEIEPLDEDVGRQKNSDAG